MLVYSYYSPTVVRHVGDYEFVLSQLLFLFLNPLSVLCFVFLFQFMWLIFLFIFLGATAEE